MDEYDVVVIGGGSGSQVATAAASEGLDVAVVEPGLARVYRGQRYVRACEVSTSSPIDGTLEKRVGDVVEYLDPIDRVRLSPLDGEERSDPARIAAKYEQAYDALLSAIA